MKIVEYKISDLIPYDKNSKKHDKTQIENVAESIKEYGFIQPIVIDKNNVVVIGHCRLLAAKKLKMERVPCVLVDALTEEQVKKLRLLDNKLNESEWDMDLLSKDILNIDFTGYDIDWGLKEASPDIIEDDPPEVDEKHDPISKLGEIYQLGNHRLMCGDSTSEEDVAKLMNGVKADMVFTDPPYGMKKENDGVANDNLNYDDLLEFNKKWIPITFNNLKDNGSWYCWGIDEPLMDIYSNILKPMAKQNKITFRNLITWDKGNGQGQLSSEFRMYPIADEKCLFCMCGVQGFNNNSDNYYEAWEPVRQYLENEATKVGLNNKKIKEITGLSSMYSHWFTKSQFALITEENYKKLQNYYNGEAFKKEYEEIKKEYYLTRAYFDNTHDNMNNVWHFSKTSGEERESAEGHATPKLIALCTRAIKSSSRENENVLDVFGGSGSTLIACEQLKRNAYLMELEPKWVDVIIQRWENFTGKKAVLIEKGE